MKISSSDVPSSGKFVKRLWLRGFHGSTGAYNLLIASTTEEVIAWIGEICDELLELFHHTEFSEDFLLHRTRYKLQC